jgi:hypothetical protein
MVSPQPRVASSTPRVASPRRAPAAFALAIYALVIVSGPALLHGFACSGHGAPHCFLCASVESVSSPSEAPVQLTPDRRGSAAAPARGPIAFRASTPPPAGDRAPPSAPTTGHVN